MDNQQQPNTPIPPSSMTPSNNAPPQQPSPNQVATPVSPTPTATKPRISKVKRVVYFIFGLFLVLFSLSVVQGQATHSWDIIGVVMILVFGVPGLYILYYSVSKVSS